MKVAVLQLAYDDREPVAHRVGRVAALVREQGGHDLVVLPELWAPQGFAYRTWPDRAEHLDGPTVTQMRDAARAAGVVLHAGSMIEAADPVADRGPQGRGLWNTSVLIGPDGALLATYRKVHRFGFGDGEPRVLEAGSEVVAAEVGLPVSGGSAHLGLATCYDLRFPEMFRLLLDAGAEVFVVPAAWPAARIDHWLLLSRARAVENQCYLVACNTAGTHSGHAMGGGSQVVAPTGEVLAVADSEEQVLSVELDLGELQRYRERFPVLADRRW
ncbi:MAG: carbon-nitrogen family hydrolase [Angustibacter sp.]